MVKVVVDDRRGLVQESGNGDFRLEGPALALPSSKPSGSLGHLVARTLMVEATGSPDTWIEFTGSSIPSGSLVLGGKVQVISGSDKSVAASAVLQGVGYVGAVDAFSKANLAVKLTASHEAAFHWPNGALIPEAAARTPRISSNVATAYGKYRLTISYINGCAE